MVHLCLSGTHRDYYMSKYPWGQLQSGGFILFSEHVIHIDPEHVSHSVGHAYDNEIYMILTSINNKYVILTRFLF